MLSVYSPFVLDDELRQKLIINDIKIYPINNVESVRDNLKDKENHTIIVYESPHEIITYYNQINTEHKVDITALILRGYSLILELTKHKNTLLISHQVLNSIESNDYKKFIEKKDLIRIKQITNKIDPLYLLITSHMIAKESKILSCYLDLELKSNLFGIEPNIEYKNILEKNIDINQLLEQLKKYNSEILVLEKKLNSANKRDNVKLDDLKLKDQVIADKDKQLKINSQNNNIIRDVMNTQLKNQQEELSFYFKKFTSNETIISKQSNQIDRAINLLKELHTLKTYSNKEKQSKLKNVEIITENETTNIRHNRNSLQTESLINSYQKTLERARELLIKKIN